MAARSRERQVRVLGSTKERHHIVKQYQLLLEGYRGVIIKSSVTKNFILQKTYEILTGEQIIVSQKSDLFFYQLYQKEEN